MELNVLQDEKSLLKVEAVGETHTLMNILRENCWKCGATQATYIVEHPYLAHPKIIVRGASPRKTLDDAAQLTEKQLADFLSAFRKASKK